MKLLLMLHQFSDFQNKFFETDSFINELLNEASIILRPRSF